MNNSDPEAPKEKKSFKDHIQSFKENWPETKKKVFGTEGIVVGVLGIAVLFLTLMIVQSCTPQKGGIIYGMCDAFLEQQTPFPETINHTTVEQYRKAVRIYYTHIDAFGEYQLELVECSFRQDPQRGVQLESVYFDHVKESTEKSRAEGKGRLYQVKQDYIDLFNKSASPAAILAGEPDLSLPVYRRKLF